MSCKIKFNPSRCCACEGFKRCLSEFDSVKYDLDKRGFKILYNDNLPTGAALFVRYNVPVFVGDARSHYVVFFDWGRGLVSAFLARGSGSIIYPLPVWDFGGLLALVHDLS